MVSLADPAPPPTTGSNSFVFAYVFAEKHMCRRSASPMGRRPTQREILDPPLGLVSSTVHAVRHHILPIQNTCSQSN